MAAAPNLRELKKQRTRDALLRVALELFTTQGFDRTTVDEITAACEISQRTFFRYFANKEEAAFAVQEMVEAGFIEGLRQRPPGESPLEALRGTLLDTWDAMNRSVEEVVPVELHMRAYQMIESTPSLLATHLRRSMELEEQAARVIAEREGLDVHTDPRPRVLVAAFGGVLRMTGHLWGAGGDPSIDAIRALTESYLDHLKPALGEQWCDDDTE
ncbi:TetR/AcrR family transcriptional regulator [Streptomyces beihaiensis]|uniref:TetR family transcriptional regulator n=1 Tax=Streptomyces beihaiensis TaxID=2984495 RepID=A0ABT3TVB0_9ACTN|nr:TetR family transcriptional regulator [Streptomyces beihaiensis]MCX3060010.1 TetR family transcriptional regulator [Streptomyces beihaiensis]